MGSQEPRQATCRPSACRDAGVRPRSACRPGALVLRPSSGHALRGRSSPPPPGLSPGRSSPRARSGRGRLHKPDPLRLLRRPGGDLVEVEDAKRMQARLVLRSDAADEFQFVGLAVARCGEAMRFRTRAIASAAAAAPDADPPGGNRRGRRLASSRRSAVSARRPCATDGVAPDTAFTASMVEAKAWPAPAAPSAARLPSPRPCR